MKRRANGEGTLRKRVDGRWESTFMIGWKDDGRRRYKSFYGKTQEEVKRKVQEWKKTANARDVKDYCFSEWTDLWFDFYKQNISEATQEGYKYTLRTINKHFGKMKLSDIKAYHIDTFIQAMRTEGIADSSLSKLKGLMFQILNAAEASDLIPKNPAKFSSRIRRYNRKSPKEAFTAREIQIMMENLPHNRTGFSIRLMLGTGLRTQEILGLEPKHISEDGSEIIIEQAVVLVKGAVRIGPPKSNSSIRRIPIPPGLQWCAIELRKTNKKFIWQEGLSNLPCNPTYFRKEYRRALESLDGVRILTPHSCRHSYVSHMQALGVDVSTIQSLVGHAEIDMTEYYLHVQENVRKEAAARFSDFIMNKGDIT